MHNRIPHHKMARLFLSSTSCLFVFASLSSCGVIDNPYQSRSKKCKANCEPKANDLTAGDEPRNSPPFSFDLVALSDKTLRSIIAIDPKNDTSGIDLLSLMSRSPAFYSKPLVDSVATTLAQAKEIGAKLAKNDPSLSTLSIDAKCVQDAFTKAPTVEGSAHVFLADYGRCVLLKRKTQLFLADKNNTGRYQKAGFVENEGGFLFSTEGEIPLRNGTDLAANAENTLALGNVFPFHSFTLQDLAEGTNANVKFYLNSGDITRLIVQKNNGDYADERSWEMQTIGSDKNKTLEMNVSTENASVTLNGAVNFLKGYATSPSKEDPFVGDKNNGGQNGGLSVEYIFSNFKITNKNLVLDGTLGFTNDGIFDGSYYLRLNAVPNGTPTVLEGTPDNTYVFRLEGQHKACELKLYSIKDVTNGKITEKLVGFVDLCKNQVGFLPENSSNSLVGP